MKIIKFKFRRMELFTWLERHAKKKSRTLTGLINDILDQYYYTHRD